MNTHPVWGVYDLYRTARLNVKYYSARLDRLETWNLTLELILAITAPSSAVAGLWFWDTEIGSIAWKLLGVIAAVTAVIKPVINLPKKMKSYGEVLSGYRALEHDLYEIKEMVMQNQKYDKEAQSDFRKALKKKGALSATDPETTHDILLVKKFTNEVNKELPVDSFFNPTT
ncbi:hypothetical protein [Methylobacter sp. YRD-M1]|uniref:hypothetical protein n=1 Tax=Methylobacter sp. YRD-M1 TaxID=2911520 RepID=UPI00227CCC0F|nr:hypothetical protein [Methylobacter sp. YRD-M1]WAK01355.1 hypothetical protein LZ558_16200 [Methylobacter sp. YRD-M1]